MALNHNSVLVPPSPNPGLAPVLLKTVPSLSSLVQLAGCRAAIRSWCPIFPRRGSFACQLHADGVVLFADSVLNFQDALDAVSGWGRKCRFTFGISPTKCEIMIFGPRFHVPSCAVTLAGTLSLVVDGVVLTRFSLGSVMCRISFHVESPIRPTCRLVSLGSSPNAIPSLSILCASHNLREVRVVPKIRLLPFDRWTVLCASGVDIFSVGLRAHRALRLFFPTCLARRPSLLRRATLVSLSLLGALSPCPMVNEAVCPRQSSIRPSPSPVHKRPIASLSAIPWVFSTALCAALALSLSLSLSLPPVVSKPCFRLARHHSSEAFLARSPCCCCFLALCLLWTVASAGPHQIVCGRSCPSSRIRFWWLARWGYDTFPGDSVSFWARHPSKFHSSTL